MSCARGSAVALGCLCGLLAATAARADADEAWLHRAELPADLRPLLALLLDTSAAAQREVAAAPAYDPAHDYAALVPTPLRCDPAAVYWHRGVGALPDCRMQTGLANGGGDERRGFRCESARASLARHGFFIASRAAQWREAGRWAPLDGTATAAVECRADRGRHGSASGPWYAADGNDGPWSALAATEIRWDRPPHADPYVFYLGNYLNYLRAALPPRHIAMTELARQLLADALRATDGLDAALLRMGASADGGFVVRAGAPAAEVAADVDALGIAQAAPAAPLAEFLAEATSWLAGGEVRFGRHADADPGAFEGSSGRYRSPFGHACRPVTVALLSAGQPSGDEAAAAAAAALPGFVETTGGCTSDCLGQLGRYVRDADLRIDTPGRQSAATAWLAPAPVPASIADAAGAARVGRIDDARSYIDLIARSHQQDLAVPAGPGLSAAGLSRATPTTHEAAVTYALAAPATRERWLGNAFRYALRPADSALLPPTIVDRDGEPALDPASGLPRPGTRSEWSDAPDADLLAGGASGRLPQATTRRVYADLASMEITDPRNRLSAGNPRVDRALVGLGAGDDESPDDVIGWLLAARPLGDPGLRAPVVVAYRHEDVALAYIATHDGLLHAIDAQSGVERWAWMPRPLMPRLARLMRNEATTARGHGIDGELVVHRFDPDGDGRIDAAAGEHLWLAFGLGRGGDVHYLLDIASPDHPRLLWSQRVSAGAEPAATAAPVIGRLATGDPGQAPGDWIVMLAAGRTLRIADAVTGRSLWSAAPEAADLPMPDLAEGLASAPRVVDLDGDGRIDRAYLLASAGSLWRFDFTQGATPAPLATARRMARLGDGTQRFWSPPDVSLAAIRGRHEIAVAAGSGRVDRPRDAREIDRVYVVLDRGDAREIRDSDLHDATDGASAMPGAAPGWHLRLDRHGPGEKVVGPSVTFDHVLRFQTYQPLPAASDSPCGPPRAIRRLYARDIRSGLPANRVDWPDAEEEIELPGLPVDLRFAFPAPADSACPGCRARPFGLAGARIFDPGYSGDPVRTSWRKLSHPPDSR